MQANISYFHGSTIVFPRFKTLSCMLLASSHLPTCLFNTSPTTSNWLGLKSAMECAGRNRSAGVRDKGRRGRGRWN